MRHVIVTIVHHVMIMFRTLLIAGDVIRVRALRLPCRMVQMVWQGIIQLALLCNTHMFLSTVLAECFAQQHGMLVHYNILCKRLAMPPQWGINPLWYRIDGSGTNSMFLVHLKKQIYTARLLAEMQRGYR